MSRKLLKKNKRNIIPDIRYKSLELSKFINIIMKSGKKTIAENIVYSALNHIKIKTKKNPLSVFNLAINNCRPLVEAKYNRISGNNILIPTEISYNRGIGLSMKWIKIAAKKRLHRRDFYLSLAKELIDASVFKGIAIRKKNAMHKLAEANKVSSFY